MNPHMRLFMYAYAIPILIGWSLLEERYFSDKLSFGLSFYIFFMFAVFTLKGYNREKPEFLIQWVFGSAAAIILIFAWDDTSTDSKLWIIGSSIFLILGILNTVTTISTTRDDYNSIETRGVAFLALFSVIFLFFHSLGASNITPNYSAYGYILYAYIILAPLQIYYTREIFFKYKLRLIYSICLWMLISITFILAARRYTNVSSLPWYLIIQPFLGICTIQIIRYIREVQVHPKIN